MAVKNYTVTVNGTDYSVQVSDDGSVPAAASAPAGISAANQAVKPASVPSASSGGGNIKIPSPMPGLIVKIIVSQGDSVKKGQTVAVLEAMKMENDITAPQDGTVASVNVKKGDNVNSGDILVTLK